MKLDNFKTIRLTLFLTVATFLLTAGAFSIFFFSKYLSSDATIFGISLILGAILLLGFGLRCVEYSNDGHVISIKKFHPLDKGIHFPTAEFPTYKIIRYDIKRSCLCIKLHILIHSKSGRRILAFRLYGFNKSQVEDLDRSLSESIQKLKPTDNIK